jgi:deoxyribonuclease V
LRPIRNHSFCLSEIDAVCLQEQLAAQIVREDLLPSPVRLIAGVDVAYQETTGNVHSAVVVMRAADLTVAETAIGRGTSAFPYRPGLFAFREIPAIAIALEKLTVTPDLIICDGHGIAHPRRLGLASHLGVLYDVPTIGCAKTRFIGTADDPARKRGASCALVDRNETIGVVLRTQDGVRPLYVSQGHRISLASAREWVLRAAPHYRIPEPLRLADRLANQDRASNMAGGINLA